MAKSVKISKIKKIKDVESNIKKIRDIHEDESNLEGEIEESSLESFGEFLGSTGSGAITPVLEASQETQENFQDEDAVIAREAPRTDVPQGNLYESSRSDYATAFSSSASGEEARSYISDTSEIPVTGTIRQERIIGPSGSASSASSEFQNILGEERESAADERRRKYQTELERDKSGDKARYTWE